METTPQHPGFLAAFRGTMRLARVFLVYGLCINWILPLVMGVILANTTEIVLEAIWYNLFFCAALYNLLYGWLVYRNRANTSPRGITPFAAWLWVSWPFALVLGGILARKLHF